MQLSITYVLALVYANHLRVFANVCALYHWIPSKFKCVCIIIESLPSLYFLYARRIYIHFEPQHIASTMQSFVAPKFMHIKISRYTNYTLVNVVPGYETTIISNAFKAKKLMPSPWGWISPYWYLRPCVGAWISTTGCIWFCQSSFCFGRRSGRWTLSLFFFLLSFFPPE